jgi:hypothetical protein
MTPYHYEVLNRQGMFIQSAKPRTIDQIKTDSTLRYILSRLSMIAAATANVAVVSTGPCRCRSPSSTLSTISGKRGSGAGNIPTGFRWSRPPTSGRPVLARPYVKRTRRDPFAARSRLAGKAAAPNRAKMGGALLTPTSAEHPVGFPWLLPATKGMPPRRGDLSSLPMGQPLRGRCEPGSGGLF